MKQEILIEKIKEAFIKVHKRVGVFQTDELDTIFEEPTSESDEEAAECDVCEVVEETIPDECKEPEFEIGIDKAVGKDESVVVPIKQDGEGE